MKVTLAFVILVTGVLSATRVGADSAALVVHEWGTFTSFQDSNGGTISGINVDDEPVPKFVHRLRDMPIFTTRSLPGEWSQGYPRCHPDVTLRLETPVLYFYPQSTFASDQSLEVRATFIGGWLTEFFPFAVAEKTGPAEVVDRSTQSSLQWSRLRLATNSAADLPQTAERVWLAPRKVRSAVVIGDEKQEAEKYLFYRGVGHIDAPLVVRQQDRSLEISLRDGETFLQELPPIWIVQVLPDSRVRYRKVPAGERSTVTAPIPAAIDTAPSDLNALRQELAEALIAEGLFKDEAQAMLETWQLSYFESEGLRLFFVLPPSWTNALLPLSISAPADVTRVMLGRVELISAHQRDALRRLYELPLTAFDLEPLYYESRTVLEHMSQGNVSHAELYPLIGREVPEALKLYDSLGRFRDALLVHEWHSASDESARERITRAIGRFSSCKPKFTR
jgi:hypothetical protein